MVLPLLAMKTWENMVRFEKIYWKQARAAVAGNLVNTGKILGNRGYLLYGEDTFRLPREYLQVSPG